MKFRVFVALTRVLPGYGACRCVVCLPGDIISATRVYAAQMGCMVMTGGLTMYERLDADNLYKTVMARFFWDGLALFERLCE